MSSTPQQATARLNVNYNVIETLAYGAAGATNFAQNIINPVYSYITGDAAAGPSINLHFEKYTNPITLAAGGSQSFTLSSLTDDLDRNFSMAGGVRLLIITAITRTAGDFLTFTPASAAGWTGFLSGTGASIKIYDVIAVGVSQTDVYPITAGSNDTFTITNGGSHPITFGIGIGGCNS
jgi:hypothetical protein